MTDYVEIPDENLEPGAPGRSVDALALRDNPKAMFEKAPGAPVLANNYIETVMIAAAQVTQSKLATATGTVSTSSTSELLIALPGGQYGFYPQAYMTVGTPPGVIGRASIGYGGHLQATWTSTPTARVSLWVQSASSGESMKMDQRYITASPPYAPYRAGDDVPLFVFALLDTNGKVMATYTALDPPWANNGPTIINPLGRMLSAAKTRVTLNLDDVKRGKAMEFEQELSNLYDYMRNPANADNIAREMARPLSQVEKNADMGLIPHPFTGNNMAGLSVVAINPTDNKFSRALAARHEFIGDSIAEIIHGDYLTLDNTPIPGLNTPPGIMAVRARWKAAP